MFSTTNDTTTTADEQRSRRVRFATVPDRIVRILFCSVRTGKPASGTRTRFIGKDVGFQGRSPAFLRCNIHYNYRADAILLRHVTYRNVVL